MKIGLVVPTGRTDRYGYQYDEFTKIILKCHSRLADKIIVISSSRHANKDLFESFEKIEFVSNEITWFDLIKGEEVFSLEKLCQNVNYAKELLKKDGCDVAFLIGINIYVPNSSIKHLKKKCEKMLKRGKPYEYIYKRYMVGRLLYNSDKKVPTILNLNIQKPWDHLLQIDSIINRETGKIIKMKLGNYRSFNKYSMIDNPFEMTLKDVKDKFDFVRLEYKIANKTYDPVKINSLKFNAVNWIMVFQNKLNLIKLSRQGLDSYGEEIYNLRKSNFVSHILEKNYRFQKKPVFRLKQKFRNKYIYLYSNFKNFHTLVNKLKKLRNKYFREKSILKFIKK